MQSCFISEYGRAVAELLLNFRNQNTPAFRIDRAHTSNVAREMTFADELSRYCLSNIGWTDIHRLPHCGEALDQIGRDDKISESQRWKHHFAEAADVDHTTICIQALQGSDWHGVVAIFAVVIVFDNPRAGASGPLEQLQPARRTHCYSQRILMRRCNKRGARLAAQLNSGAYVQAFAVHWNRHGATSSGLQNSMHQPVARLFYPR